MKSFIMWIGLLVFAGVFLTPQNASAQSLFEHANTEVPKGQTVDNVYVVGGDTDIGGHITGALVVFNGNLHLGASARVDGAVVVIGGSIKQEAGAVTSNDIYNFTVDTGTQNSLLIGGGMIASLWILQLAGSMLMILIPVLVRLIGRGKTSMWLEGNKELSWRKRLYLGLVSAVILAAFSLLCLFTVVGIPLLIVVIVVLIAAFIWGITTISYQVGGFFQGNLIVNEWTRLIIGALMITAFCNIPVIGEFLLLGLLLLSLGNGVHWFSARRRSKP